MHSLHFAPLLMKRLGVILALLCCCAAHAQSDGIWFLRMRMTNGVVVLVEQKKTPGVLKRARAAEASRSLQVHLRAADGTTLATQSVDDPTVRRIEFADADGRLHAREVTVTNAEFTVRVPYHPNARVAVLTRMGSGPARPANSPLRNSPTSLEIGRVELKPEAKQ